MAAIVAVELVRLKATRRWILSFDCNHIGRDVTSDVKEKPAELKSKRRSQSNNHKLHFERV